MTIAIPFFSSFITSSGNCEFETDTCGWNDLSSGSTRWNWAAAKNATPPYINYDSTYGRAGMGEKNILSFYN